MSTQTTTKVTAMVGLNAFYYRENALSDWKPLDSAKVGDYVAMGYKVKFRGEKDGKPFDSYMGKEREINSAKSSNYDEKIGSFGVNYADTYELKYGKTLSSRKTTINVSGRDLRAKLRDLFAKSNKGFIVNDIVIRPSAFDATDNRKQEVDSIVNSTRTDEQVASAGIWQVTAYFEGTWTWFKVQRNGVEMTDYAQIGAFIPEWGKLFKETFDGRGLKFSDKRKAWKFEKVVSTSALTAFFSLKSSGAPMGDSAKEQAIVKTESAALGDCATHGDVVSKIEYVDPVYQNHAPLPVKEVATVAAEVAPIATPEISVKEQIAILYRKLDNVQSEKLAEMYMSQIAKLEAIAA